MSGGRRRPVPDTMFGGRLAGCVHLDLTVTEVLERSARMRTLRFASPDLVDFVWAPGQDVMVDVPGRAEVRRRYTIRRADPVAGTMDVDVVLHDAGALAGWARGAQPGEVIDGIGPRGNPALRPEAARHLFVVDTSGYAAMSALVEALPAGTSAVVLVVDDQGPSTDDRPVTVAALDLCWITRAELDAALGALEAPEQLVAYVYGEAGLVHAVNGLLGTLGVAADAIVSKAYWRRGRANAPTANRPASSPR